MIAANVTVNSNRRLSINLCNLPPIDLMVQTTQFIYFFTVNESLNVLATLIAVHHS